MSYFATNPGPSEIPPDPGQIAVKRCSFCDREIPLFATSYELRIAGRPGRDRARRPSIENPSGPLVEVWLFDSLVCLDTFIWTELEPIKGTG